MKRTYFILVKRKGKKQWEGALVAKKGIPKPILKVRVRQQIRPMYASRIVSEGELRRTFRGLVKAPKRQKKRARVVKRRKKPKKSLRRRRIKRKTMRRRRRR